MPRETRRTSTEEAFLFIAGVSIFASSWLLGVRFLWAQWILFGLCLATGLLGLRVFQISHRHHPRCAEPWAGWKVSGVAAIAFVTFVGVQSANVAFIPQCDVNNCVLIPVPHVAWLPSSVGGPFDGWLNGFIETENAARYLLIYSAAALGCLGVALGTQSRFGLRTLGTVLVVHGLLSAVICIAHQASGSTKVLWLKGDPVLFLGAPFFFYKNHNAAYQTLLTGWVLGWLAWTSVRKPVRSPTLGFALFVLAEVGLASIRSRAGLLCAAVLGAAWLFSQKRVLTQRWRSHRVVVSLVLIVLAMAVGTAMWQTGGAGTVRRFGQEGDLIRTGLHGGKFRFLQHQFALEMFKDRPWFGWGAGSFLYNYAGYDARVPEMASNRPVYSYYLLSPHADGDWYELLAECGVVGTLLFAGVWLPHLALWWRRRIWRDPGVFLPALAAVLVVGHGLVDSVFRNAGLLLLLGVCVVLITKRVLLRHPLDESDSVRPRENTCWPGHVA